MELSSVFFFIIIFFSFCRYGIQVTIFCVTIISLCDIQYLSILLNFMASGWFYMSFD